MNIESKCPMTDGTRRVGAKANQKLCLTRLEDLHELASQFESVVQASSRLNVLFQAMA